MAAKQGLTAHISQASEDARRAVLSRAPTAITSHSWLSNLNTTCTIKSAPPRTPEVMTLLSTRSGWLVKRNEQQVWQRRWCCVVPHTFLYYFEAEPVRDGDQNSGYRDNNRRGSLVVENQDQLNDAVRDGCKGKYYNDAKNSPLKGSQNNAVYGSPHSNEIFSPAAVRGPTTTNGNLAPAGIIDLECYTSVNRSSRNELVFELTGDEKTNPDLRSFYFQAGSVEDCEQWTNALLSDRHSALKDEREAYRQVTSSFQLQLQSLSDMIDEAEAKAAHAENQLYNVRSGAEKFRSQIVNIVREALEQQCWNSGNIDSESKSEMEQLDDNLEKSRLFYMDQIDEVISSANIGTSNNAGALITQVLADYLAIVVKSYKEVGDVVNNMENKFSGSAGVDKAELNDLKDKIQQLEAEKQQIKQQQVATVDKLTSHMSELRKTNEELEDQLQTQRVEFSMFQSQAKSKLQELSKHKKILKKEVIDLRKKIDEVGSERDAALHITDSHKLQAQSEKEKNEVLERYIEKIESQVAVQQNMMEMMSLSGMSQSGMSQSGMDDSVASRSNSVVGRIIAAPDDSSFSSFGPQHFRTSSVRDASPYRLPPTNRAPSDNHPPLSPKRKKSSKPSVKGSRKPPTSKMSSHRGTLDHEFLSHQNDNSNERDSRYHRGPNKKTHDNDSDDDRSNVSELTEDRTQRAFDAKMLREHESAIQYTTSEMTGENVVDGVPEKNSLLLNGVVHPSESFPPKFIMGAPENEDVDEQETDRAHPPSPTSSKSQGTKLSVAQKARLNAELNGNTVDVSAEAETIRLREAREREEKFGTPVRSRSQSPGMFSNLASMISKRKDGKSITSDSNSIVSTQQSSEVTLTLAERQQQQRENQLRVLKEQGLIKDGNESVLTGGAGAQSIRSNSTPKSRS